MSEDRSTFSVMGLCFPTEEERVVVAFGRARDQIVLTAASAVILAGCGDAAARRDAMDRMVAAAGAAGAAIADGLTRDVARRHQETCGKQIAAIHAFAGELTRLEDRADGMDRPDAIALLERVQNEIVPAIVTLTDAVLAQAAKDQNAVLFAMRDRASELEGLFSEMDRIGRTVRLISINASVEAARTGGEGGRAFQVIAQEIRKMAQDSAELLSRVRDTVAVPARDAPRDLPVRETTAGIAGRVGRPEGKVSSMPRC